MSAMHWEARRRQSALDHRTARDKQQQMQNKAEPSRHAAQSNAAREQTVGGRCPHCQGGLETPVQQGAKLPNRYSSVQYSQQW